MISLRLASQIQHHAMKCPSTNSCAGVVRCFQSTRPSESQNNNTGGIFGSANDYFSSLRWKAANALTSTLPEDEKNELMQKLEPKLNDKPPAEEENTVPQRSIDETVAAARAEEAKVHEQRWEKEKEKLVKEAEEAALARVESDFLIQKRQMAFEAWKRDLEEEKAESTTTTTVTTSVEEMVGEHPILGPILADLGCKRIHLASAKSLATIPVWEKQRIYRHGRAKSMATDKMKTLHLGLPGIIGLYERADGSLSIIDGQHRVGMLKALQEKAGASDFDFNRILVEVYPQSDGLDDSKHAKEIFVEVNKAEPVKLVDMPGVAKKGHREMITEGANKLKETFPDMFSESQRCRVPHLNLDNLRDALFASNAIERHSLKSSTALDDEPKRTFGSEVSNGRCQEARFADGNRKSYQVRFLPWSGFKLVLQLN